MKTINTSMIMLASVAMVTFASPALSVKHGWTADGHGGGGDPGSHSRGDPGAHGGGDGGHAGGGGGGSGDGGGGGGGDSKGTPAPIAGVGAGALVALLAGYQLLRRRVRV